MSTVGLFLCSSHSNYGYVCAHSLTVFFISVDWLHTLYFLSAHLIKFPHAHLKLLFKLRLIKSSTDKGSQLELLKKCNFLHCLCTDN